MTQINILRATLTVPHDGTGEAPDDSQNTAEMLDAITEVGPWEIIAKEQVNDREQSRA